MVRHRMAWWFVAIHTALLALTAVAIAIGIAAQGREAGWYFVLWVLLDWPMTHVYVPLGDWLRQSGVGDSENVYIDVLALPCALSAVFGGLQWWVGGYLLGWWMDRSTLRSD